MDKMEMFVEKRSQKVLEGLSCLSGRARNCVCSIRHPEASSMQYPTTRLGLL